MNKDKSIFAKNLRKIRLFHDLTQNDAARLIGISRANLRSYEEGRAEPPYNILRRICKAYGIERMDRLMFSEDFLEPKHKEEDLNPAEHPVLIAYQTATLKERRIVNVVLGI